MKVTIYANYGVLAHEYTPVFTLNPISRPYDRLVVEIPGAEVRPDYNGEEAIFAPCPNGKGGHKVLRVSGFLPEEAEIIPGKNDEPVLHWYAGRDRKKPLKVLERTNWENM